jgi:tetratricopeptide (TPR) repeat protein
MQDAARQLTVFLWTAVAACVIAVSAPASAQDTTSLTESQLEYNNKGVTLINKGEFEEALGYFQSSLAVGEANITYLNLGRTYTRMERCADAATAFERAEEAPAVSSPSRQEVQSILERYRAELEQLCSARLRLECDPQGLDVRVDDAPQIACPDQAIPVTPGEHVVIATYRDQTKQYRVEAVADEVVTVDVSVPGGSTSAGGDGSTGRPLRTLALATTIGGGALLATGFILDQTIVTTRYDELEAASQTGDRAVYDASLQDYRGARNANRAIFVVGGVAAASGLAFWLLAGGSESNSNASLSVVPQGHGVTVQIGWRR